MTLIDKGENRDVVQDMFDRADTERYQCPSCKFEYTRSRMIRMYINTPKSSWMQLAGREGYEYYCPHCGALVKSEYIRMS